jgi:glycosyltransferase involved in cell wall biosynthesis
LEPEFSVIIPTYNRAATLSRAIESVINQTYPAKEILVMDDGSSDNTREVVEGFPQVRYFYQENAGVSTARNKGAEIAAGEWLIFLDSDDELMNHTLEKFSNSIKANPTSKVFRCGLILFKNDKEYSYFLSNEIFVGQIPGSFAISKTFFQGLGGYDQDLKFGENTELFFRVGWSGEVPVLLEELGLRYFQQGSGASSNLKNVTEALQLILAKHDSLLNKRVKRLYNQILGVNYLRIRQFAEARKFLFKAYLLNPMKIDTLGRCLISLIPVLARRLYTPIPEKK